MKPLAAQDHYQILELPRGARAEEIERAYRLAEATFAQDSLALYSLMDERDASEIRSRVQEAYRVLSDGEARAQYDRDLSSAAPPDDASAVSFQIEDLPSHTESADSSGAFAVLEDDLPDRYDGASLRAARQRRSLELKQIATITKVNPRYLRYIEEENLEGLPAPVYVRGFVYAYAQVVGLDPQRATTSYMELFDEGSAPKRSRFLARR